MTGWAQLGDFTFASGRLSSFKIECDDLTDDEVAAMCAMLAKIVRPFGEALGVPTGGIRVAEAMAPYATNGPPLVVDDVWTTGGSMRRFIAEAGVLGAPAAVLFARGPTLPWVTALFTLHEGLWAS